MAPNWSPDSRKISYLDAHLQIWYVDIEQKKPVKVDKDRYLGSDRAPVWSPDSKWLAYSKRLENYLAPSSSTRSIPPRPHSSPTE